MAAFSSAATLSRTALASVASFRFSAAAAAAAAWAARAFSVAALALAAAVSASLAAVGGRLESLRGRSDLLSDFRQCVLGRLFLLLGRREFLGGGGGVVLRLRLPFLRLRQGRLGIIGRFAFDRDFVGRLFFSSADLPVSSARPLALASASWAALAAVSSAIWAAATAALASARIWSAAALAEAASVTACTSGGSLASANFYSIWTSASSFFWASAAC